MTSADLQLIMSNPYNTDPRHMIVFFVAALVGTFSAYAYRHRKAFWRTEFGSSLAAGLIGAAWTSYLLIHFRLSDIVAGVRALPLLPTETIPTVWFCTVLDIMVAIIGLFSMIIAIYLVCMSQRKKALRQRPKPAVLTSYDRGR